MDYGSLTQEDEWEIITQNIGMSLNYTLHAIFEVFNKSGNRYVNGIVTSVSKNKFKIELENGFELG